jgi:hypothetical protein
MIQRKVGTYGGTACGQSINLREWGLGLSADVTVKWMYTVSLWRTSTMHTYLGAVVHSQWWAAIIENLSVKAMR